MPKKAKKKVKVVVPGGSKGSLNSELSAEVKPKKQKPLTKKEIEKMKRMEKELREALIIMKKAAEDMLADYKAMEDASLLKASQEEEQQAVRVQILTETCKIFNIAKLRLIHENNKIREEEIWNRYITTDQKPYPESTSNMRSHLYLWQQHKVTEDMDSALDKCDIYVNTLDLLDELIEYPLYSPKEAVANWKELRAEWRQEFLDRIDKCCFYNIKNLAKNFKHDQGHIHTFDFHTKHLKLGMSAWTENHDVLPSFKWTPRITFKDVNAEFVMPAAYRQTPFILRLVYLNRDFFSDNSLTSNPPPRFPMETDLLKEVNRCFEAKKEAKMSVADREREKVKAAKQKYLEAQEAANQAEKSFKMLQKQTKELKVKRQSRDSSKSEDLDNFQLITERRKKPNEPDPAPETSLTSVGKRRGAPDTLGELSSTARVVAQSAAMKSLDTISMRSGMRKKIDKFKKTAVRSNQEDEELTQVFKTRSMVSVSEIVVKTQIRKDSELCFEESEVSSAGSLNVKKAESFDSLDLMLGKDDDDQIDCTIPTLRQLIKKTEIIEREGKQPRQTSKTIASSISSDGRKKGGRGKSVMSVDKKPIGENPDEIPSTASDIFESKEDARQEQYLTSLFFQTIPQRQYHLNLREYNIVSGTYLLDLIRHVSQPRQLTQGTSVQLLYGEMNIKREEYEYKYVPPPPQGPDEYEPVPDNNLQHLLHVKIPLPKNVVYFESPAVALWDRENKYWTIEHVHKLEIDQENNRATFSLSKIMPFAFCLKKFSLIPYLSWNLKPKFETGGVVLTIKSAMAAIEFHVLKLNVSLIKAVTNDEQNIEQVEDIIGEEMHLNHLISVMKSRGINVFPDEDACLYTENSAKDVVLEEHTNLCIAMWSENLEFQGCEWNGDFRRRKLAFRVREYLAYNLELRYRTVVASSLSAMIYRLGVEDGSFNESKVESYGFCPDVLNLLEKAFVHVDSSRVSPLQVVGVYSLLSRTKLHSYCGVSRKETLSSSSDDSRKSRRNRPRKTGKQKRRKATNKSSGDESAGISEVSSSVIFN